MERIRVIYRGGADIEFEASDGTYTMLSQEIANGDARYLTPTERSKYKYIISLDDIVFAGAIKVDTTYTTSGEV